MSTISDEYTKYQIFNKVRYFIYEYVKSSLSSTAPNKYYIHGGNTLLNFIDQMILDKIMERIMDNENLSEENKNFLITVLYSEDIDIVTSRVEARKISEKLKADFNENQYYRIFLYYINYVVSYYMGWSIETTKMSINIIDNSGAANLYKIIAIISDSKTTKSISFVLCDIYIIDKYIYKPSEEFNNIIGFEFTSIIDQLKMDKIYHNKDKRIYRIYFFINILYSRYLNFLKIKETYSILSDVFTLLSLKDILEDVVNYIEKENIIDKGITIERIGNNTFNILFGKSGFDFFKKNISSGNLVNNLTNGIMNAYEENNIFKENFLATTSLMRLIDDHFNKPPITIVPILTDYETKLKVLDLIRDFSIKKFTGNDYKPLNDYIFNKIYGIIKTTDDTLSKRNSYIKEICYELSKSFNDILFETDKYIYVYRGENYVLTGPIGSYNNLKKGDVILLPTNVSTSISKPWNKSIILRIRLDVNSKFTIIMNYSSFPTEKEILLPFGTMLKINDVINVQYQDTTLFIDSEYISTNDIMDVDKWIDYYRNYYLMNKNNHVLGATIDPMSLIDSLSKLRNIPISTINTTILNSIDLLVKLPEINIDEPYKDIKLGTKKLQSMPDFSSPKAFDEEIISPNTNEFCEDRDLAFLKKVPGTNLNILTLNVHNFVKICPNPKPGRDYAYLVSFLNSLLKQTHINFISLQEVSPLYLERPQLQHDITKGTLKPLIEVMKHLKFEYYSIVNTNHNVDNVSGDYFVLCNCIFSNIEPKNKINYGLEGNRVAQVYEFQYNQERICIINTHLEYDDSKLNYKIGKSLIDIQIEQLNSILMKYNNYILTGDFNHDIITHNKFKSIMDKSLLLSPKNAILTAINSSKVIDFILISREIKNLFNINFDEFNIVIKSTVSDHYPVFATIEPRYKINLKLMEEISEKLNKEQFIDYKYTIIYKYFKMRIENDKIINTKFGKKNAKDSNTKYDIYILPDLEENLTHPFTLYLPLSEDETYLQKLKVLFNGISTLNIQVEFHTKYASPYKKKKNQYINLFNKNQYWEIA